MMSLPLTIVCLAAVLPIHLTSCGDPLLWASVEAQAVYNINPDGVHGGNCSSVPNTFEMRVDGSWLSTSEFGLTGNFDEDCGIQIHLSIPEGDDQLKETVDLKTARDKINNDKKDLQVKEDALEDEKKAHEKKMQEHNDQIKALKMEEKALKTILQENKSEMDKQKNRKNDMDSKRKILEYRMIALGDYSKVEFIEREENRVSQEKSDMEKEIRRLERLISAECWMIHDIEYMIIFSEISEYQQNINVCTPKE